MGESAPSFTPRPPASHRCHGSLHCMRRDPVLVPSLDLCRVHFQGALTTSARFMGDRLAMPLCRRRCCLHLWMQLSQRLTLWHLPCRAARLRKGDGLPHYYQLRLGTRVARSAKLSLGWSITLAGHQSQCRLRDAVSSRYSSLRIP